MQIDICVCTFRRPQLRDTLRSLAKLQLPGNTQIRVIVADNDDTPSGRPVAEETARECNLKLRYIHAPARNISVARNACLDASDSQMLAFIDDDEIAEPQWLNALMQEHQKSAAPVILGQVRSVYHPDNPDWMGAGDFHAPKPVWVGGQIVTGYTCNVLLDSQAPGLKGLRFRKELGLSGGEDTVFFKAAYNAGCTFSYAEDAVVTEAVTPARARFSWLLKRYFRFGQTHALMLLEERGNGATARAKSACFAGLKALFCYSRALFSLTDAVRCRYWILRGTLHLGVVSRLFGKSDLKQYG